MTISVKEVGVGTPINPWENHKDYGNGLRMSQSLPALDTKGNPLPVGECEVDLVWQYNHTKGWSTITKEEESIYVGTNATLRQVYIRSVAPEKEEPDIEAVSVEALAEREYPFTEKHPNALHLPLRICERKAYVKGYTAALSAQQPEKDNINAMQVIKNRISELKKERKRFPRYDRHINYAINVLRQLIKPQ